MSDGTHFQITKTTVAAPASRGAELAGGDTGDRYDFVHPLAPTSAIPSTSTGAQFSANSSGGGEIAAGGAGVGLKFHQQATSEGPGTGQVVIDTDWTEAVDVDGMSGPITGYSQTTINLPVEVMASNNKPHVMIFWTPDRDSCAHVSNINFTTRVAAKPYQPGMEVKHTGEISLKNLRRGEAEQDVATKEKEEIIEVIKTLVTIAVEAYPAEVRESVKAVLEKERGWGVIDQGTPVIESAYWTRSINKMEHHAAGVVVSEMEEGQEIEEGVRKSKHTKHIVMTHYSDSENGINSHFQIVVPPFGSGKTSSGSAITDIGSLLRHEKVPENTFVANTVFKPHYVRDLLANVGSGTAQVAFHQTHMLWAFQHMDVIFEEYVLKVQKGEIGVLSTDEQNVLKFATHVEETKQKLRAVANNKCIRFASDIIQRTLLILAEFGTTRVTSGWWKFHATDAGFRYYVPASFYRVIVHAFAKRLQKFQAFNGGTDLLIGAAALPSYTGGSKIEREEDTSVYLELCIKAYFPNMFWCYIPDSPINK